MIIKITGIGSYTPSLVTPNKKFENHIFFNEDGTLFSIGNKEIIEKFKSITGIEERKYITDDLNNSDIAFFAAQKAIKDANIDAETLDYIILAHNYGDVSKGSYQSDTVPSIAARVKQKLGIKNPNCVAYDILFGCPGWIEAVIIAQAYLKAGMANKCLVIGSETLSRVIDPHDRNSMIFSDGAGATILENKEHEEGGILSYQNATYTFNELDYINFGNSFNKELKKELNFIKMKGRKVYEFALNKVPLAMKNCLDKAQIKIEDLKMIFIHQANEKMDKAIINRFFKLYNKKMPAHILPMNINTFGNSSVATLPTLFDLVSNHQMNGYDLKKGDIVLFASIGAGMNINAITYQI